MTYIKILVKVDPLKETKSKLVISDSILLRMYIKSENANPKKQSK